VTGPARPPRFSIVTPVYDVAPYLPDFVRSIEHQRIAPGDLEVVAVDDGSTDRSLDLLREWAGRSRFQVKVFTKPNGGQGSARNLGLEQATGEWVTFPDPDDLLDRDYLRAADRFARARPDVELLSARPVLLDDSTGTTRGNHPRQWQYDRGNRVADLSDEPDVFLGLAPGSFYRLARIQADDLRFDTRIRPNFEDAHFAVRYLLGLPTQRIGLLRDSTYVYRKRSDGSSTLQRSMRHPGRFSDVLELGYLDVLARGRLPDGSVAPWIQQLIVYELSWYLSEDERISTTVRVPPGLAPRFHELLDRILGELDPAVVAGHRSRPLDPVWVDLLAHVGRGVDWHSPRIVCSRHDRSMGLRRFQYRYVGRQPREAFRVRGESFLPAFEKTMAHRYFERDFLWERILWLPDVADLDILLDDEPMALAGASPRPGPRDVSPGIVRSGRRVLRNVAGPPVRLAARFWPSRARFRDAWVLMDRIHDADDNGERLFEYLRGTRPDINAWFVLERGTPDWERLRARGERRLVAHGSWAWMVLMLNCTWLIASHVDRAIVSPRQIMRIQPTPTWRLGFLQHGVTKDDLSRWLNNVELDLFVVSTEDELASVAGDGTAYRFTARETRNTGLPRFDRQLAKGRGVSTADRDLVIVAPTWRQWLTLPLASGSQRRELDAAFWESEYVRSWTGLLRSPMIADAVARRGWRLGFMPHPNLQPMLGQLDLPADVEPLSFAGVDVQELYGRCALLVTDYSSVAFNLAYIDRPVVYFQFDREAVLGGFHVGRKGYFEYARDGFGPVAENLEAAEREIVAAIQAGRQPAPEYLRRIAATFQVRDGQACARVVAAVEELSRPWRRSMTGAPSGQGGGSV
jgi:glycosyltransferase involved in cell wall biosynthesis/CDP-glycerol glycerophosphotransferase (TagB/SpsB family)